MWLFLKNLIFTLLVPGTVAIYGPIHIASGSVADTIFFILAGVFLLVIGLALYSWCVWDFAVFGKGTPAPVDAPKHLVIRGLYRYTRNPMYLGVLSVILGWALLYSDLFILIYCLCVALSFQLFVVFYEEPLLQKLFGSEYAEYKCSVNRWLPQGSILEDKSIKH